MQHVIFKVSWQPFIIHKIILYFLSIEATYIEWGTVGNRLNRTKYPMIGMPSKCAQNVQPQEPGAAAECCPAAVHTEHTRFHHSRCLCVGLSRDYPTYFHICRVIYGTSTITQSEYHDRLHLQTRKLEHGLSNFSKFIRKRHHCHLPYATCL